MLAQQKIRTIADLKDFLKRENLSPERLGAQVRISNMTIRRLLRRPDEEVVPEKYHAQLDQIFAAELFLHQDFGALLDDIEKTGNEVRNAAGVKKDLKTKLKDSTIGKALRSHVNTLVDTLENKAVGMKQKSVCLGALLYLINPADLIPDTTPVVGYLDDFAVLSLAVAAVGKNQDSQDSDEPT